MSLGSRLLGPLADKSEPKRLLSCSLLLTFILCGIMLFFSAITDVIVLAASLGILGLGLGANATIFMKIVLSSLSADVAGSGTGTYGLFRDLAAPFGVAVFVPMFTNQITRLTTTAALEITAAEAAVASIRILAIVELCCVLAGIVIVQFLPKVHENNS